MQYLLVFVGVLLIGVVVFFAVGTRRRVPGSSPTPTDGILGLAEPVPSLPPVLLPAHPGPEDIARMRLGVGLRGYRCDQVDEVIGVLTEEIGRLNDELDATRQGPVISATEKSPE
ncbi:MAG: DivIVA domain-containing protein [Arthrobacter sp.]|uniref:DivIVA domain-containing protein n=1 Tax=unclassified Arthrobacter TaxID=235627 RepID=UPI002656DD4E|nr:DivIVA domain-containing protein [Micrococcaceae bacterium]MDN5812535.1 DivIVA domain-containing protein [Micrococcaceae bacterium]MDN5824485.1 DivIVA domain-containing protein [Micrococcaceae bacterium]MDN5879194.1 DivIVA domain-containing protein [Micrococcaceae bacterium]MDN5886575.1 DivIVA domain-containing protein [Micrococcaceae bacterium]